MKSQARHAPMIRKRRLGLEVHLASSSDARARPIST
jgi:hypothetical protein